MKMRGKRKINWKLILIILFAVTIWFLVIDKYNLVKIWKNKIQISKNVNLIENLTEQKTELQAQKTKLENENEETIEKKAREIGLTKPGEKIIRIIEEEKSGK
ncbi:MAG: septum formation initiator family protein [Candidatus Cloacimonetes bacterium]|nr:septum formation initiator family protein [Candidatus Cloacimonadota bacterium]